MSGIFQWFITTFGGIFSKEMIVFMVSITPILECRGGLVVASYLGVDLFTAMAISILGNIAVVPFILLFIKRLFSFLKRFSLFKGLIEKLEARALHKSKDLDKGEFIGLLLFVGIPLPGTGAYTGTLIASLLEMDVKKASIAIVLGVIMASTLMAIFSYGLLNYLFF